MSFLLRKPSRTLAAFSLVGIASTSYLYYRHRSDIAMANQTFEISVHTRDSSGHRVASKRVLPLLLPSDVEKHLKGFAKTDTVLRDGIRWNWHTAQVAANSPIEDAFANVIVERDPPPKEMTPGSSNGDLLFFTVFDGHGGPYTSRLLSKTLIPTVALELSSLMHQPVPDSPPTAPNTLSYLRSFVTPSSSSTIPRTFDHSPAYVSLAIQTAFANLDSELINAPLRIMADLATKDKDQNSAQRPTDDPMALASIYPALSGSCALLALLDTGARNMYVACTGDSRAVAGYLDADTGTWTMEVLTEDQTGSNPNEMKSELSFMRVTGEGGAEHLQAVRPFDATRLILFPRMQSEHPPEESQSVIQRGRVLGGLEPTRAFGDARYKWTREVQERITQMFFNGSSFWPRPPPSNLTTPPYVTSQPVVTCRTEFLQSNAASPQDLPRSKMRFLILATDGLWDRLSSQEACALVAGHLAGFRGAVLKRELGSHLKLSIGTRDIEGKDKGRKDKGENDDRSWMFKDENLATHLARNAFGRGNEQKLRELLSIPAPLARSYRDDITVTVVWWEEGKVAEKQQIKAML